MLPFLIFTNINNIISSILPYTLGMFFKVFYWYEVIVIIRVMIPTRRVSVGIK